MKRLDLVGKRFGKLLVVSNIVESKNGKSLINCLCDCGTTKVLEAMAVKRGHYKSCGCNQFPTTTKQYREHPLYDVWKGMKARCRDKNNISYKNYGAKGVTVCEEWKINFKSFYDWAMTNGWTNGMQIDKDIIPKKLGIPSILYSPEMCSVVTAKENKRASPSTKLTEVQVLSIRASKISHRRLANIYGVGSTTIGKIKNNQIWEL